MATTSTALVALAPFPLLQSPHSYVAGVFDYYQNCSRNPNQPVTFETWIEVFRKSIPTFRAHAAKGDPDKAEQFAVDFDTALNALLANPRQELPGFTAQPVSCATLCHVREKCLHNLGYTDIFSEVKQTENKTALKLLPQVLQDLDQQPNPTAALEQALRGVFAGNIFDLGAAASAQRYAAGQGAGFHCTLEQLLSRPWVSESAPYIW
eukprot:GHUV01018092.1.p1 GENE.GHUV01018092.1~~GHUV01018092.1.p1  ORF type:complete len:208 (+),score=31.45 GHUV01018092.1:606-1229(+)